MKNDYEQTNTLIVALLVLMNQVYCLLVVLHYPALIVCNVIFCIIRILMHIPASTRIIKSHKIKCCQAFLKCSFFVINFSSFIYHNIKLSSSVPGLGPWSWWNSKFKIFCNNFDIFMENYIKICKKILKWSTNGSANGRQL